MKIIPKAIAWSILLCAAQGVPALAQNIVLPKGDPQLQGDKANPAEQEAVRDSRMKQQGQGSNYRVEGTPQPGATGKTAEDEQTSLGRQDTGLSDPTVNPGQAAGMQSVQGRIVKSDGDTHIVRQLSGPDTTLTVDDSTAGDKKLAPGDVVTGLVMPQGRAVAIHKEQRK